MTNYSKPNPKSENQKVYDLEERTGIFGENIIELCKSLPPVGSIVPIEPFVYLPQGTYPYRLNIVFQKNQCCLQKFIKTKTKILIISKPKPENN